MSHHRSPQDLLRPVLIPDENPAFTLRTHPTLGTMSMVAGDFTEVYSSPEDASTFSCVVTVFFLDTAANPLRYIETIHHVLQEGGWWINLGPLAWHFEPEPGATGGREGGSVELTLEELVGVIERMGFVLEGGEVGKRTVRCGYMGNERAMLNYIYDAEFFVARKATSN
jgi:carnosine N-methyltransferase